jgi:hypothetical protein
MSVVPRYGFGRQRELQSVFRFGLAVRSLLDHEGNAQMDRERDFTQDEIYALSIRAVNHLIAAVEDRRLMENKELAETIAVCIRKTELSQLWNLRWHLEQLELEGAPPVDNTPRWIN